jgi:hypothetical protein
MTPSIKKIPGGFRSENKSSINNGLFPSYLGEKIHIGCPTLGASLFLRLGWETTNQDQQTKS